MYGALVIALAASVFTGGASMGWWAAGMSTTQIFAVAVAAAFVSGAVASQSLRGGLTAAFGAALTFGIGAGNYGFWEQVAMNAVTGGIMESLQGGNFGNGFVAAGLTAAVMPQVGRIKNDVGRTALGAIIGGSMSELTGGKFANGAVTGAIQGAMSGHEDSRRATQKIAKGGEISDQTGAPGDIVNLLKNDETALQGFRELIEWAGYLVPDSQVHYTSESQILTRDGYGAAGTNMETGHITFSRSSISEDFWITLSNVTHEYGHYLDWRFELGSTVEDQVRAYRFQINDYRFERTPSWYQEGVKKELRWEEIKCQSNMLTPC